MLYLQLRSTRVLRPSRISADSVEYSYSLNSSISLLTDSRVTPGMAAVSTCCKNASF